MALPLPIEALVIILPYVFSLIVLSVVRKTEIYCREPWAWVFSSFIYGSTLAVFLAIILDEGASIFLGLLGLSPLLFTLTTAAIVAPIMEESAKATGILSAKSKLTEVENGIIYGAAVGLGFSATENVIYFVSAYYMAGVEALVSTIILRFLTSTFLHLGASGVAGYGIGVANMQRLSGAKPASWTPFLLAAMGLHAFFNFLSYLPSILSEQFSTEITAAVLFMEMALVWLLFITLRRKIKTLDRTSGCAIKGNPPLPPSASNLP
jgi:RsiW-degrading membrane proteinase PrsW (M82 family)